MANYDEAVPVLYDSGVCYDESAPPGPERIKMSRVKLELRDLDPDGVTGKADAIKTAMTGNANFPTPNPPLATVGTDNTTAKDKIAAQKNAQKAAKDATVARDLALLALKQDLTSLAAYVQNASGGDRQKILSAGMDVYSEWTPLVALDRPVILSIAVGKNPGELRLRWTPIDRAKSYQLQVCVDPINDAGWKDAPPTSDRKATLTGLTSGTKVWVQVRPIAKDNQGPWSEPVNIIVP